MTNNYIGQHTKLMNPLMLLAKFLIYLLIFHVPFSLVFRPEWSERIFYFIFSMVLVYFPFLFWEMHSRMQKERDYRIVRNGVILFSFLVGLHWLLMMYHWASPERFVTLNELLIITVWYCFPWALFAWITAKIVWKLFGVTTAPRRRLAAMVAVSLICTLYWLGISFYTIYFLLLLKGP